MSFGDVTVKVRHQVTKEVVEASTSLGDSLEAAIERWGNDVVYTNFVIGAKTSFRNKLFSLVHDEDDASVPSAEDALAQLANWKPTVAGARAVKDPFEAFLTKFNAGSDEEKAALIQKLTQALKKD